MTPRPLSKERRAEIERHFEGCDRRYLVIDELLAAEEYWREAVKNAQECPSDACAFCSEYMAQSGHRPGCPWLLAR